MNASFVVIDKDSKDYGPCVQQFVADHQNDNTRSSPSHTDNKESRKNIPCESSLNDNKQYPVLVMKNNPISQEPPTVRQLLAMINNLQQSVEFLQKCENKRIREKHLIRLCKAKPMKWILVPYPKNKNGEFYYPYFFEHRRSSLRTTKATVRACWRHDQKGAVLFDTFECQPRIKDATGDFFCDQDDLADNKPSMNEIQGSGSLDHVYTLCPDAMWVRYFTGGWEN